MKMPTIEAVSTRLDGLERENKRLRWIAGGLLAGLFVVGASGILGRDRGGRTLEAQKLVIRDKEGRVRGSFGVDHMGMPGLKILDRRGNEQIELGVPSEDTSSLAFYDRGTPRILLDTSIEGSTTLRLFDQSQMLRSAVLIKPDGAAELVMGHGKTAMTVAFPPDGQPLVITTDARGRAVERPIAALAGSAIEAPASLLGNLGRGPWPEPPARPNIAETEGRRATRGLAN
jgi:hypothetical protein